MVLYLGGLMKTKYYNNIDTTPGALISHANTWPSKWSRTTYRISEDGNNALPLVRENFWGSVAGKVEDVSRDLSVPVSYFLGLEPGPRNVVENRRTLPFHG